jgi:hypothetical protein
MVNFTPPPLYPWETTQVSIEKEAELAKEPVCTIWRGIKYILPLPGFEPRTVQPVAYLYTLIFTYLNKTGEYEI